MKNKETRIHPTQKPVALYAWIFRLFAKPGMKILDTHLGSGSSRLAAWDAGLDFTGYEIDKTYFDLQEQRFQNYIAQDNLFWNLEGEEK
jgi:site-specific DNA-methyltransferase (adenine-specific)